MKIEELIKKVCAKWDYYKSKEVTEREGDKYNASEVRTMNGHLTSWDNPNLLWLMVNVDGGGYEEYGNQVGLTKDGDLVWEYQSHCSCNGFADTKSPHGDGTLCLGCDGGPKNFKLNSLPDEWEKIIKANLEQILGL